MKFGGIVQTSAESVITEIFLANASDGQGKTGLSAGTSGLIIAMKADNEASPTVYREASSNIEGITGLSVYSAPSSTTRIRFQEINSAMPGMYQVMANNERWAVTSAFSVVLSITAGTSVDLLDQQYIFHQNTLSSADMNSILSDYGTPTWTQIQSVSIGSAEYARDEATTAILDDTTDIQARLPSSLSSAGNILADVRAVNDITIGGAGTSADPWGPA